ncbi:MAG: Na+:solute symporter [Myxococcales bacterium]|nr:Na+:solute symporter [Myxococcales bacterium]
MKALVAADWAVVGLYLCFTLAVGFFWRRRAGKDLGEFFLSGRSLPWWLAGTSMVATTFGSDTPLLVAGIIGQRGIAGNWWWWSFVLSNVLTVFFFSKLWRRTGITTDVELSELRYGGSGGRWLRGVRAVYFGGLINTIVLGMIMLGGQGIVSTLLGVAPDTRIGLLGLSMPLSLAVILVLVSFVALYSTLAGLWGVVSTDLVQFAMATLGCLALAYYTVSSPEVGGLIGLRQGVATHHPLGPSALDLFPSIGNAKDATGVSIFWFVTMMAAQWWASWYPGSEPGGGGYIVQRVLASKDERAAQLSTLWFTVAHYAVRPWPWILVALAGFVAWPDTSSLFPASWQLDAGRARELTFVAAIPRFLPAGLAGLMVASLIAALMSTVDTHMNWGASYIVNDFYRRFLRPDRDERHYVRVSRVVIIVTIVCSALLASLFLDNIKGANELIVSVGAGAGLVYILRWFWPRISAWSEIASMIGALVISQLVGWAARAHPEWMGGASGDDLVAIKLLLTIALTTLVWLVVTFITPREQPETLERFYRTVRPPGPLWRAVAEKLGMAADHPRLGLTPLDWVAGCLMVWAYLLFVGQLLVGMGSALPYAAVAGVTTFYLAWRLRA